MAQAKPDDWFVSTSPRPHSDLTLFAFPQAGGGCSAFAPLARQMPAWLELATLNLPGRQARIDEPACTDLDSLTPHLVEYCAKHARPFMFFGYCAGALIAYLVARGLQDSGSLTPQHLVIGSYPAPHEAAAATSLADLPSDAFWKALVDNNAVSPDLAARSELRSMSEQAIRADMALAGGYKHAGKTRLDVPITVLVGERDKWLAAAGATAWAGYTSGGFDVGPLPAGHWFVEDDLAASAAALTALAAAARR